MNKQGAELHILLIEDDVQLGQALQDALRQEGMEVRWAMDLAEAELEVVARPLDLILLDLGLPDGEGLDLLHALRRRDERIPVVILSAREAVGDRIRGLDAGADDYLAKPFEVPELVSRLRAVFRRSAGFAGREWVVGDLVLRPEAREVLLDGKPVALARREYEILLLLVRRAGRVMTRRQLEEALAEDGGGYESNALEVHVHHLRRKLRPDFIQTVRGVGYMVGV